MEIKPEAERVSDRFLNVLTASDISVSAPPKTEHVSDDIFDGTAVTLPGVVRNGIRGTLKAFFMFRREGEIGGRVKLLFSPDGSASPLTIVNRALSDKVLPQKGLSPLP